MLTLKYKCMNIAVAQKGFEGKLVFQVGSGIYVMAEQLF